MYNAGTITSNQHVKTSQRNLRRLLLRRIMNCWIAISRQFPELRGCERTAAT
jgi:hypothetical protein